MYIIVIIEFSLIAITIESRSLESEKHKYHFQYGYRKCRIHARVFSQILSHLNSKNETRQRHRDVGKRTENERK